MPDDEVKDFLDDQVALDDEVKPLGEGNEVVRPVDEEEDDKDEEEEEEKEETP